MRTDPLSYRSRLVEEICCLLCHLKKKKIGIINTNGARVNIKFLFFTMLNICAITTSILYVVGIPLLFLMAQEDDAPGIVALGLVITFASIVIAVFAAVLQKLLKY